MGADGRNRHFRHRQAPGTGRPAGRSSARGLQTGFALGISVICLPGCQTSPTVSFAFDVYPIIEQNCLQCHTPPDGEGYVLSGLDLTSYEGLLRGSHYGRVIIPGKSSHSVFNMTGEGRVHPNLEASQDRTPLSAEEARILREWVDEGAPDN